LVTTELERPTPRFEIINGAANAVGVEIEVKPFSNFRDQ
jgi:hypothetical protein